MISAALSIIEDKEQRNELADLYEKNFKIFYSIALKLLNRRQDAEDAMQEAFMSIAENPDLLFNVPQEKRVVYIKSIVRNISYRIWRKRTNTEKIQVEIDEDRWYGNWWAKYLNRNPDRLLHNINYFGEITDWCRYGANYTTVWMYNTTLSVSCDLVSSNVSYSSVVTAGYSTYKYLGDRWYYGLYNNTWQWLE